MEKPMLATIISVGMSFLSQAMQMFELGKDLERGLVTEDDVQREIERVEKEHERDLADILAALRGD